MLWVGGGDSQSRPGGLSRSRFPTPRSGPDVPAPLNARRNSPSTRRGALAVLVSQGSPCRLQARLTCCDRFSAIRGEAMDLGLHYWNFSEPSDPAAIAVTVASAAELAEQCGFARR